MLSFEYTAKNKDGKRLHGVVEAPTESAAAKALTEQNLTPLSLKPKEVGNQLLARVTGRIKAKDKIIFTRQLATLINAGLPLTQALHTVLEQTESKPLQSVIGQVLAGVEGGSSFSEVLAKHPIVFPDIYVALVAAGEASGTLDQALERIATQQEKDAEMLSKVRGALVYPLIVTTVIVGVVIFLLTTVVPQIKLIYTDFDRELPFLTGLLIALAGFITRFWWLIIIILVAGIFFLIRWSKTEAGSSTLDRFKLNVPVFKSLFMLLYMARFCRTSQTLMATGVQLLETLRITARAVDNVHIARALSRVSEKVKGGKALSVSIKAEPSYFLALVHQMISVGEKSGAMDTMMDKAASYYEEELDNKIKTISTTIEPVLMVFLAIVVGGIVMAILVPVYSLANESLAGSIMQLDRLTSWFQSL